MPVQKNQHSTSTQDIRPARYLHLMKQQLRSHDRCPEMRESNTCAARGRPLCSERRPRPVSWRRPPPATPLVSNRLPSLHPYLPPRPHHPHRKVRQIPPVPVVNGGRSHGLHQPLSMPSSNPRTGGQRKEDAASAQFGDRSGETLASVTHAVNGASAGRRNGFLRG